MQLRINTNITLKSSTLAINYYQNHYQISSSHNNTHRKILCNDLNQSELYKFTILLSHNRHIRQHSRQNPQQ